MNNDTNDTDDNVTKIKKMVEMMETNAKTLSEKKNITLDEARKIVQKSLENIFVKKALEERKAIEEYTTIRLSKKIKEALNTCGHKGESYDQILIKLIKLFSKGEGRLEKQVREYLLKQNL
ncbi:MAG: hypothetical protein NTU58_04020 [Candidatus Nealsonbacteria bacterium]|nr:hypothetical protein [Candidatus Nealsonbacteria bacterium]